MKEPTGERNLFRVAERRPERPSERARASQRRSGGELNTDMVGRCRHAHSSRVASAEMLRAVAPLLLKMLHLKPIHINDVADVALFPTSYIYLSAIFPFAFLIFHWMAVLRLLKGKIRNFLFGSRRHLLPLRLDSNFGRLGKPPGVPFEPPLRRKCLLAASIRRNFTKNNQRVYGTHLQ